MMKRIGNLLIKEFLQLVRTPALLAIIVLSPLVTIGLVPFAMSNKVRCRVEVIDRSFSDAGREAVAGLSGSKYIVSCVLSESLRESVAKMDRSELDLILVIEPDGRQTILADGTHNLNATASVWHVCRQLEKPRTEVTAGIRFHHLFSSGDDNTHYYLVSMLVLLVTIVSCSLITVSVISEKESKMLEHLISTGLRHSVYLASKLLFISLIGLLELMAGLLLSRLVFSLHVAGSLLTLAFWGVCFIFPMLNLSFLIAYGSRSQVQAIFILVFALLILILLSTMFAPLDHMSDLFASTRFVNPFFWMIDGSWMIILKGYAFGSLLPHFGMLLGMGAALTFLNLFILQKSN